MTLNFGRFSYDPAAFMSMSFGRFSYEPWSGPPTAVFLEEIRPWLPAAASGLKSEPASITAANARIHEALKQTVPMHFSEETLLEDVLKSIKKATVGPDGKRIPMYVDPVGGPGTERVPPTVRNIDFDGVLLRTTLRFCLDQYDLTFAVKDGVLLITSKDSIDYSSLLFADARCIPGGRPLCARARHRRVGRAGGTVHLRHGAGERPAPQSSDSSVTAVSFLTRSGPQIADPTGNVPDPLAHANSFLITRPPTSVKRSSRPLCRKVSCLWSRPMRWRIVA